MKHDLLPMGTKAHEMDMALSGIMHGNDDEIRASHNKVLQDWWEEYGEGLSIALTDTYGTDFFFRDMAPQQAREWKGLRQDSGDPFEFGEKAIEFYKRCEVDPREKLIVFSDGLDVETIVKLADSLANRIKVTFGWGTNLTNDLGFPALSLIVKLMESNGYGTVKLSDNLAKALGNAEDVERFKHIFGYTGTMYKEVKY
jgi:nicotinate phosphoribosyltransferase